MHYLLCQNLLCAFGIPQFATIHVIYVIYCIYYTFWQCIVCTGNPLFHIIHCAQFIGTSTYSQNATIYRALFIMPGFIVATENPIAVMPQFIMHHLLCQDLLWLLQILDLP